MVMCWVFSNADCNCLHFRIFQWRFAPLQIVLLQCGDDNVLARTMSSHRSGEAGESIVSLAGWYVGLIDTCSIALAFTNRIKQPPWCVRWWKFLGISLPFIVDTRLVKTAWSHDVTAVPADI